MGVRLHRDYSAENTSDVAFEIATSDGGLSYKAIAVLTVMHLTALGGVYFFSAQAFLLFLFSHFIFTCIGISIGFHHLVSHKSFRPKKIVKWFLTLLGTLSWQGGPIYWAMLHRSHHSFSEKLGDPHSAQRGFWWSHFLWLLHKTPNDFSFQKNRRLARDLFADDWILFLEKNYLLINSIFALGCLSICVAIKRFDLFFWFFPIRIIAVWHSTWIVNSLLHHGRSTNEELKGKPINSHFLNFITYGEGAHEEHHKYPQVIPLRSSPYKFNMGKLIVKTLRRMKLVE